MTFEDEWARCGPWIEDAIAHAGGTHTLSDVEAMVRAGEAFFWSAPNSAVVSVIQDDPQRKTLLHWLAGGDMAELLTKRLPDVEAWGLSKGCTRALLIGRAGWERAMAPYNYKPLARIVAKELTA